MNSVNYQGDHVKDLHNRILGPDEFGAMYVVTDAIYENDHTKATLRPATADELENAAWTKDGFMTLGTSE